MKSIENNVVSQTWFVQRKNNGTGAPHNILQWGCTQTRIFNYIHWQKSTRFGNQPPNKEKQNPYLLVSTDGTNKYHTLIHFDTLQRSAATLQRHSDDTLAMLTNHLHDIEEGSLVQLIFLSTSGSISKIMGSNWVSPFLPFFVSFYWF